MNFADEFDDYALDTKDEDELDRYYAQAGSSKLSRFKACFQKPFLLPLLCLVLCCCLVLFFLSTTVIFGALYINDQYNESSSPNHTNETTTFPSTPPPSSSPSRSSLSPSPSSSPSSSPLPSSAQQIDPIIEEYWKKLAKEVQENLNKTADPCVDFYEYACGGLF